MFNIIFVHIQHDDDLWEELIQQCLHKLEMVRLLNISGLIFMSNYSK